MKYLLFILCLISVNCFSQTDSLKSKYERETIFFGTNTSRYIKNGEKYKVGWMGRRIEKEMAISPDALVEFNRYKKKNLVGLGCAALGYGLLISGFSFAPNTVNYEIPASLSLLGLATMSTGVVISVSSIKHFNKAVWLRNIDALIK